MLYLETGSRHLTPVYMASIKKTTGAGRGCGEVGTLMPCWENVNLGAATMETVWRVLKK